METPFTIIIGLGKTGLSCVHYLQRQGKKVAVMDSRENPPGLAELRQQFPHLPIYLGKFDEAILAKAQELIMSPGVALQEPAIAKQIARGAKAIGDIELFAQAAKAPIVAITGTNGKSTVTTLVGEMAKVAGLKVGVGGNLGTPVLELLADDTQLYVLEISSFQLETTFSLKPQVATVLNISPDHLDRYPSMQEYITAKQRIYQQCKIAVINRQDKVSYSGLPAKTPVISFGLDEPKQGEFGLREIKGENWLAYGEENLLPTDRLKIKGRHQWANALSALALGTAVKLPMASMLATLQTFLGLAHRCQWTANIAGVDWYNDSKGTNVSSTLAAIEGLGSITSGKLVLIAGGLGKNQDFSPLRAVVTRYVRSVVLIGQDKQDIAEDLKNTVPLLFAENLAHAIEIARNQASKGDAVLLSPACASFDMFRNFEDRGEKFMQLVKNENQT